MVYLPSDVVFTMFARNAAEVPKPIDACRNAGAGATVTPVAVANLEPLANWPTAIRNEIVPMSVAAVPLLAPSAVSVAAPVAPAPLRAVYTAVAGVAYVDVAAAAAAALYACWPVA